MTATAAGYILKEAIPGDEKMIAGQRASMFRDMGLLSDATEAEMLVRATVSWLAPMLRSGEYVGWVVFWQDEIVAGGGMQLQSMGPVPGCLRVGRWGHIMNVYTEPAHRRRGLGRLLMDTMLRWAASQQLDQVTLAASEDGRHLYESLGFVPTPHMRLSKSSA